MFLCNRFSEGVFLQPLLGETDRSVEYKQALDIERLESDI